MKKIDLFILFFAVMITVISAEMLEITIINVGQGDSIFIKAPNGTKILIDAGSASDADQIVRTSNAYCNIGNLLNKYGVSANNPLDYFIITHYHDDHYDYVADIIKDFGIPRLGVLDRGGDSKWGGTKITALPTEYIDSIKPNRNPSSILSVGAQIDLGSGAYMQLLAVGAEDNANNGVKKVKLLGMPDISVGSEFENAKSLVFILRWNGFDMLLGGDCNEDVEESLGHVLKNNGINVDIFKVHHHGSQTSNSEAFLSLLQPEVAVCSTGHNGSYQHPRKEAYDRLYTVNRAVIFQTNRGYEGSLSYAVPPSNYGYLANGNIKIETSGDKKFTVNIPNQQFTYSTDD